MYRAVADVFFVPFDLISSETVTVSMARVDLPWVPLFLRSPDQVWRDCPGDWGRRPERTDLGLLQVALLPVAALGGWVSDLILDFADAKALQAGLLVQMAGDEQRRGARRDLMQGRLAPLLAGEGQVSNVTLR